jgi:predicted dehydrogenase
MTGKERKKKNKVLCLGVVGGGEGATKLISSLKDHRAIHISSVACRSDELARIIDPSNRTDSYELMLKRGDIDAVYIATPNNTHIELALRALDAGKHVIVEKPLSHSIDDAQRFMQLPRAHSENVVAVAFKKRYGYSSRYILEAISNTDKRVKISYKWYLPAPLMNWKYDISVSGGGIIMDLGSHILDLFEHIAGKISSVQARIKMSTHFPDIEDFAEINVCFHSGSTGEIELSWLSKIEHQTLTVSINSRHLNWARTKINGKSTDIFTDTQANMRREFNPADEYKNFLNCFHKRVYNGIGAIPSIESGLRNLQIINAAYRSAKSGRPVEIP